MEERIGYQKYALVVEHVRGARVGVMMRL
jgi:hypothetical protein